MNNGQFLRILVDECSLDLQEPVVAGISGGPDSICLLDLLHRSGVRTIAAHLDHSLRESSAAEAEYVAQFCADRGILFSKEKVDAGEYAILHHLSIEEGARELRYKFLFRVAREQKAQAVLVAHHADDQTETVLMHLMRGSGLSGLAGMRMVLLPNPWNHDIPLIRPLLYTWRREIEDYCLENDLKPVLDSSNLDTQYYRNRIRHELIPELQTYNPLIKERIQKMSDVVGQDDDFMCLSTEKAWGEALLHKSNKFIVLHRDTLQSMHPAILRRVIRQAVSILNQTLRDIDFDCVERGVNFIERSNQSNHEQLCAGLSIFSNWHDQIMIAYDDDPLDDLWPQLNVDEETILPEHGEFHVGQKWLIRTSIVSERKLEKNPFVCQMDADRLLDKLVINVSHPGDRFTPFGMGGKTKKLGDFWTNEGLPARARIKWPLIRSGDQIVWIPGFRIAEGVQVTATSKKIIQIEMIKKDPAE